MLLKIRHALLEVSNPSAKETVKQSAVIINNEIIISCANILQTFARQSDTGERFIHSLQQCNLVDAQDVQCSEGKLLRRLNYLVTFDRHRRPVPDRSIQQSSAHPANILTRYTAQPLYVFCAAEVSRSLHKILRNADSDEQNVLRSSFLVLTMRKLMERESFKRFIQHISSYLRYLQPIHTLDDVLVMCSPFGMENFYKTISIGKVCNVLGNSLFGLSNALPLGCEGAAVFNNKLRLIGIIICTSFQRQQENVNLILAANFGYIVRDFMAQLGTRITILSLPRETSNFSWERSIVVIESASHQGTGTYIRVHDKCFILTCAHVVGKLNSVVQCRAFDREFPSDVIWCNPDENRPYDLALLTAPADIPRDYCVRIARNRATLGQTVYNAGFPYYVNFNFKYDFNPSIFQGRIIKCDRGAIMSDGSVQSGQSGGPMFDQNGCILGVCVSNIKHDDIVYPNINTAIPTYDIRRTLHEFATTNDVSVLNNLVASQDVCRVWSLDMPPIQSKL
ncbi:hypothetical protein AWZ03_005850 [Drosophila navojoa]|uniref:Peroxisomal leader peptide-processing protease n=1 Tax=Drosophila navojoa TaxID=7232 RepID=A0A484BFR9_DRONA|nr:uncharacterized protein LOC108654236 [Drosophila navojoa]TDG47706.1 hypothetical protein AWZ03_005850 [Drosophila navojoa]